MLYGTLISVANIIGGLFAGFLLLRFWMQAMHVKAPIDLAKAMFQLTDWLVRPMRRVVPGLGGYDWASLIAAYMAACLTLLPEFLISPNIPMPLIAMYAFFRLLQWIAYGLMGILLLEVVFSWINPYAPLAPLVRALNNPLLAPVRRLIPTLGSIDFSPLLLMIVLQILARMCDELPPRILVQVAHLFN